MLVVLAEIDCLNALHSMGVHPDEFYTDLDVFKHRTVFMKDVTILVIFAGNCRFNKKHTLEFVKTLMKRSDSETDKGIDHVYIISDMTIAGIRSYYRYTGSLDRVDIMHGWKVMRSDVDIWRKLRNAPVEATCYLSPFDQGATQELVEQCKAEAEVKDKYADLIAVPDLREMLRLA